MQYEAYTTWRTTFRWLLWFCLWLGTTTHAQLSSQLSGWNYDDHFSSSSQLLSNSCMHSALYSQGAQASEPYLAIESGGRLALVGYDGEPAIVGYCTPSNESDGTLYGRIQAQVTSSLTATTGQSYLYVAYSSNARQWSTPQALSFGYNDITVGPMFEAGFVVFMGHGLSLDSLTLTIGKPVTSRTVSSGASIQSVIDQAFNGDVIEVASGTYSGDLNTRG
ncbi:MAG: hypothetical protein MI922_08555, partial [Bacteroidales bacterium]|nr:hypothetical protein [Bacteroidales bacterium]